jgi:hypothetical protein
MVIVLDNLKAIDSNGQIAECDERLLPGVALENPKAAGGEHPLRVFSARRKIHPK